MLSGVWDKRPSGWPALSSPSARPDLRRRSAHRAGGFRSFRPAAQAAEGPHGRARLPGTGRVLRVLEEDPAVEPAAFVALGHGQRLELAARHGERGQQGIQDFPDVS